MPLIENLFYEGICCVAGEVPSGRADCESCYDGCLLPAGVQVALTLEPERHNQEQGTRLTMLVTAAVTKTSSG